MAFWAREKYCRCVRAADAIDGRKVGLAGVEGTLSQSVRRSDLRHCRYCGLAKTHWQHVATAVAVNVVRVVNFWNEVPLAPTRKSRFARLCA